SEAMAVLLQLSTNFLKIVNLAVEHQPDGTVARFHRLGGGFARILDLKPAECQSKAQFPTCQASQLGCAPRAGRLPDAIDCSEAFAIGTAMGDAFVHREQRFKEPLVRLELNDGAQPAHSILRQLPALCP